MATVLFGLAAALSWGGGDFSGGFASRRTAVYGVVLVSQLVGMAIALALALARSESLPTGADFVWCVLAGAAGVTGITALYRGLSIGRMGIVAPVTGVLAATIPVVFGIALQGLPTAMAAVGIGLAIGAVLLVSREADHGGGRAGLAEALVAGVGFGLFGVLIAQIGEGIVFSALFLIRAVQAVLVVGVIVVVRSAWRPGRKVLPLLLLVGILDMGGNAFYLLGVQSGQLAIAAVLSSLYPVVTVILAAVLLRERVTQDHAIGIGMAAVAIALIGLGST
jgi:drug/metabolite transporter (DMT)-like permease